MILQPHEVFDSVSDGLLDFIRVEGLTEAASVREAHARGELLKIIDESGLWLPAEARKLLERGELERHELLSLARLVERQNFPDLHDDTCAINADSYSNISPSAFAAQLRAEARGLEIPESDWLSVGGDSREVVCWHGLSAYDRIRQFFTDGLAQTLGEEWPAQEVSDAFKSADFSRKWKSEREGLNPQTLEPEDADAKWVIVEDGQARGISEDGILAHKTNKVLNSSFRDLQWDCKFMAREWSGSSSVKRYLRSLSLMEVIPAGGCSSWRRGDLWLSSRHLWLDGDYRSTAGFEYGSRWNVVYTVCVLFALGVLGVVAYQGGFAALPIHIFMVVLPILLFWWALRHASARLALLVGVGILLFLVGARVLFAAGGINYSWLGGAVDPSLSVLCVGAGALIGLLPVYWGGLVSAGGEQCG